VVHRAPDPGYGQRLTAAFSTLDKAQVPLARTLQEARTPRARSAALAALAGQYLTAQTAVSRARPTESAKAANAAIKGTLGQIAADYRRLRSAVRRGNRRAYDQGRSALAREQQRLKDAAKGLERVGYRVR
jgi:hypothetical protein